MTGHLTKGKLVFFEDKPSSSELKFQFNPAELSITKTASWKTLNSDGRTAPKGSQYICGAAATLTLTLLFDSTDTGDSVMPKIAKLQTLLEVDDDLPGYKSSNQTGRPPRVKLVYGETVPFECVCLSLTTNYTYFAITGEPMRARAEISLQQFGDGSISQKQNPTSGTPRPHRLHTVSTGETLDRIAARHYGRADKWRLIADANPGAVVDPLRIPPGLKLVIPDLRGADHG